MLFFRSFVRKIPYEFVLFSKVTRKYQKIVSPSKPKLFCITNPDWTGSRNLASKGMHREKNSILIAVFRTTKTKLLNLGRKVRVIRLCIQWTFYLNLRYRYDNILSLRKKQIHLVIFAFVLSEIIFNLHSLLFYDYRKVFASVN